MIRLGSRRAPAQARDRLWRALGMRALGMATILSVAGVTGSAGARELEAAVPEDGLSAEARENLMVGAVAFQYGNYRTAESQFTRVARLAPDWVPIHYNLGIVAEAQGKVADALRSYDRYLPHAPDGEREMLEARIRDLERRRVGLRSRYRRQAALGGLSLGLGLATFVGGLTMVGIGAVRDEDEVFTTSSTTQALIGGGVAAVIVGAGVTFGLGMTLLLRARRTKRAITFLPAASPQLVGARFGWRF